MRSALLTVLGAIAAAIVPLIPAVHALKLFGRIPASEDRRWQFFAIGLTALVPVVAALTRMSSGAAFDAAQIDPLAGFVGTFVAYYLVKAIGLGGAWVVVAIAVCGLTAATLAWNPSPTFYAQATVPVVYAYINTIYPRAGITPATSTNIAFNSNDVVQNSNSNYVNGSLLAGIVLSRKDDLQFKYTYYHAANGNPQVAYITQPFGVAALDYAVTLGLKHKLTDHLVADAKVGYASSRNDTTGGRTNFFLGTDRAPHPAALKEHATGCAGCYTAHAAIEMYAEAFDSVGALDRLEAFASFNGPDFYDLPRNTAQITLQRQDWRSPVTVPFGEAELKPLRGGEVLPWRLLS